MQFAGQAVATATTAGGVDVPEHRILYPPGPRPRPLPSGAPFKTATPTPSPVNTGSLRPVGRPPINSKAVIAGLPRGAPAGRRNPVTLQRLSPTSCLNSVRTHAGAPLHDQPAWRLGEWSAGVQARGIPTRPGRVCRPSPQRQPGSLPPGLWASRPLPRASSPSVPPSLPARRHRPGHRHLCHPMRSSRASRCRSRPQPTGPPVRA